MPLTLTRRVGQKIVVDDPNWVWQITVTLIKGGKVRLEFDAPPSVRIDRSEIFEKKRLAAKSEPRNDTP